MEKHYWPNKNNLLRDTNIGISDFLFNPRLRIGLVFLVLPFLVLFLFALSQAGTSLFLLSRFGFSHPVAILFASMVCFCLTGVYFQKISTNFSKVFYKQAKFYKAYKDLYKSFDSVNVESNEKSLKKIQAMWLLLQNRHIVNHFRLDSNNENVIDIDAWFKEKVKDAQHNLGSNRFKLKLYDESSEIYKWCLDCVKIEKQLNCLFKENNIDTLKQFKVRSKLVAYRWQCLEKIENNNKELIQSLNKLVEQNCNWDLILRDIKTSEDNFYDMTANLKEGDTAWFNKFKHQRIRIDHKLNPDPELYSIARFFSYFGGIGNMMVGNNLIGLYGSIAGVAALISFYPILHLSITIKILFAIFGCFSAAYASYALTWPMLMKLLKHFTRWRIRIKSRNIFRQKSYEWLTVRSIDWRICVCIIFAGVVTISAVNFNVYATWHLTNRLIALFPNTIFASYLSHTSFAIKFLLSALQAIISFFCAGAIYFTSCFNQYVGQSGKTKLRFISVIDKIFRHVKQKSWLKVIQLVVIVTCSLLAAIAQSIIWFHGITTNLFLLAFLTVPSSLAFFATFCEAALACLDSDDSKNIWASDTVLDAWMKLPSQLQSLEIDSLDNSIHSQTTPESQNDNDDNDDNDPSAKPNPSTQGDPYKTPVNSPVRNSRSFG